MNIVADERDYLKSDDETTVAISENTPIRLALVVLIISGIVGFTWWASGVQSSLNILLAGQVREIEGANSIRSRLEKLERDSDMFTQMGSPALRNRIEPIERWKEQSQANGGPIVMELTKRITDLEIEIKAHRVVNEKVK